MKLPDGDPAPVDGMLPAAALDPTRPLGLYLHIPFCATRCGYCDFNTYTAGELGADASTGSYLEAARRELDLAAAVLAATPRPLQTVFVGGGTPSLLAAEHLVGLLDYAADRFGLADDVEVTTEANPESTDRRSFEVLRAGGFTRVSLGMQSAAPHVLAALDRRHTPGRVGAAVAQARAAGFAHLNVDLIYGTPGETDADWEDSLAAAVATGVDHVSAYSLIVEEGTKLAAKVRRGELPAPDDDVLADRYETADRVLERAGLQWYEVSNWARTPAARSAHNRLYWTDGDWWGIGPGAHSHVGGIRWWNVKHPAGYAQRLAAGVSPAAAREQVDPAGRRLEQVMLAVRLREGLDLHAVSERGRAAAAGAVDDGLLDPVAHAGGRAVLTLRGRLLADAVVRLLTD